MVNNTECWVIKKQHIDRISFDDVRMLKCRSDRTRKSIIANADIRDNLLKEPLKIK